MSSSPHSETAQPLVAVVVLNWHGRADTVECVRAFGALSYSNRLLILIDNGCDEFSADELSGMAPGALYVRTATNLGFTGGSNLGMWHALDRGAQYVWFLNNDARPERDALSAMIRVATSDATIGIVGPKILQARDPVRIDSIALSLDLRTGRFYLMGHDEVDQGQYDQMRETRAVTGCAMLVSRTLCERLHGFRDDFFAYLEDADLCLRAAAAGFAVVIAPAARVLHNRPSAAAQRQSAASLYYTTRNHLMLMREHGAGGGVSRVARAAIIAALSLGYALRSASRPRLRAVLRGVRDYARGVTGALAADEAGDGGRRDVGGG